MMKWNTRLFETNQNHDMMQKLLKRLLTTEYDLSALVLRVVLGGVMFAHGAQKLFGIWGGHGMEWTVEAWIQWWGMPELLTYAVIFIESLGAILLVFGVLTRIWAFLIGVVMLVAVYLVHLRWGFYMNWYAEAQTGEGFEYHILVMAIVVTLLLKGGGAYSLDMFMRKTYDLTKKDTI